MKPYVLLNSAMTVDGKIATRDSSMKISGSADLVRVHRLRKQYDGIMVGINTVVIDNPKLTVHKIDACKEDNPVRIVVDSNARTPLDSLVLNGDARTVVVVSSGASEDAVGKLREKCEVLVCGENHVNLKEALSKLYDMGIKSILLEGGSTLNFSMFKEQLIDEVSICIGSKILGGTKSKTFVDGKGFSINECVKLELKKIEKIDENDVVLTYTTSY
ncbi:2,5-diamino-6-(ribosylamino)-4(3H)-pyrimidinone 5'-phosphate reductase [Methanosphaera sp. ISO3-F5]|uniref:2,5-diamino-6-(ribosylamino)-4(3H)-pyrimidinone 5'-phosphate reductase n=1 Tax=Methanosphaera sp. ISO3-F5 TaxID=1452353 RepID=UPI002B25CD62|nr:2,5-diamino-6-(ribosylamino)-4(3H)-pyrimidinone 5'-phosphate reductase [Methanosphaera sp. ISO3-F5]WQH64533.1 2,5-diamino-6-(ribosylamino)-4(3H)-pyrimidinone 5'-phosphate reductase [Methanosphaera sp. ISO3-F5]